MRLLTLHHKQNLQKSTWSWHIDVVPAGPFVSLAQAQNFPNILILFQLCLVSHSASAVIHLSTPFSFLDKRASSQIP